ncbi:MAG: glycerol-phosphatase [Nocardioidaceae bacterium]|nr:glycerol-phosphatase [Nocardioidaceae bacterium]
MTQRSQRSNGLGCSDVALSTVYDLAMVDLDGVVYVGADAVPGAADSLAGAQDNGMHLAYITNNASRPPAKVAEHLRELGMPQVADTDVVNSAQAVAHLMADALPADSAVLVVGGEGLLDALADVGLRVVTRLDDNPAAVVQGFHPDIDWRQLAEASYAIQSGLPWYASNTDLSVPTARGIAPGNGSLVQAVANATGETPIVAGKPEAALFHETMARVGGERPLMIGDRIDTDIDGAIGVGIDSLAVLTGVTSLRELISLAPDHRPTYVSKDLGGVNEIHPPVQVEGTDAKCGSARASVDDGVLRLEGAGVADTTGLRALIGLAWHHVDHSSARLELDGTLEA